MTSKMDFNRKYSQASSTSGKGIWYTQDGKDYDLSGEPMEWDDKKGWVKLAGKKKKPAEKVPDPEYDGPITSLDEFDEFVQWTDSVSAKAARAALAKFAGETLEISLANNRKLGGLIDEVRAEFKAMLEAGIE